MSREIKFRAFIKATNGNRGMLFSGKDLSGFFSMKKKLNKFGVMQYTGLKNKNGDDIYEDDICKKENGDIVLVVFVNYCWILIQKYEYESYKKGFIYGSEETLRYYTSNLRELEVIGNIHEDPELMN